MTPYDVFQWVCCLIAIGVGIYIIHGLTTQYQTPKQPPKEIPKES